MATITFDPHKFVKTLQDAGFEPIQAEAVSKAVLDIHNEAEVATKQDLRELELKLDAKITTLNMILSNGLPE